MSKRHAATEADYGGAKRGPGYVSRSETRDANEARKELALGVIVMSSGFLCWHEGLRLGGVNKRFLSMFKEESSGNEEWKKLLETLDGMVGTSACGVCEKKCWPQKECACEPGTKGMFGSLPGPRKVLVSHEPQEDPVYYDWADVDPRAKQDYDEWPLVTKCKKMALYVMFLVKNLLSYYDFENLTDPSKLPSGLTNWRWWRDVVDGLLMEFSESNPKRHAFALNMISLCMAKDDLTSQTETPYYYSDAFLGIRHNCDKGSSFAQILGDTLIDLLPCENEDFERLLCENYLPKKTRDLLGPIATKMDILSVFYDMCPPEGSDRFFFPTDMERIMSDVESDSSDDGSY